MDSRNERRQRKSLRLQHFDYSCAGYYFITICTHRREPYFGAVVNGTLLPNAAGIMVESCWRSLPQRFAGIRLGEFVAMPDHIHGVIEIVGAPLVGARVKECPTHDMGRAPTRGAPTGNHGLCGDGDMAPTRGAPTVGDIVGAFKSLSTNAYINGVKRDGWMPFDRQLWQRNYYEHIIRDEQSLADIADYIRSNPARWQDETCRR